MQIVSIKQRGFIRDRSISDCVILASESVNLIDKRQYGEMWPLRWIFLRLSTLWIGIFCLQCYDNLVFLMFLLIGFGHFAINSAFYSS